jgi:hypothetical protein
VTVLALSKLREVVGLIPVRRQHTCQLQSV